MALWLEISNISYFHLDINDRTQVNEEHKIPKVLNSVIPLEHSALQEKQGGRELGS